MGELAIGDQVFDERGQVCNVIGKSEVLFEPTYRVAFSEGSQIVAGERHEWLTSNALERLRALRSSEAFRSTRRAHRPSRATGRRSPTFTATISARNAERAAAKGLPLASVRTTGEIAHTLTVGKRTNHSILVAKPLSLPDMPLLVDPYVLGAWLGDGSSSNAQIAGIDDAIFAEVESAGYVVTRYKRRDVRGVLGLSTQLRQLGVFGNKHIPAAYLRASIDQRLALLQGLMDTDGYCDARGQCEITLTRKALMDGVQELAHSLGIKSQIHESDAKLDGRVVSRRWRLKFVSELPAFRLARKLIRQKRSGFRGTHDQRYIVSAELIDPVPLQCIEVDSPSHLYLAGWAMIPTHNSHAIRWDGILFCIENPGLQAFLFRRTYKQLYQNHILQIGKEIPREVGVLRDDAFHFINGSKMHFCHCQNLLDYLNYMGAEMHWLGVDEAGLFFPLQLIELRGRVRLGGFSELVKDREYLPRTVFGSNPGGPAHTFLKRTFIDPAPGLTMFRDTLMEQELKQEGWTTCYIPARMADNKFLDSDYGVQFAGMNPARAKALKEGDWDVVEGAALHSLSRQRHMVKPFIPPEHWVRFMSLDWGTAKPFSVGWYAVASEDTIVKNNAHLTQTEANPDRAVYVPKGSVVYYGAWYGCAENQPDMGLYLDSTEVARGIVKREEDRGDRAPDYRVCDTAIFNRVDGPSIAERMEGASRGKIIFGKVTKNNEHKYNEFLSRLAGNPYLMSNGRVEKHPTLFICSNCTDAWRTLPALMVDPLRPDFGPSDRQEDHEYDQIGYALMSRPYSQSKREYEDSIETLTEQTGTADPYAVR